MTHPIERANKRIALVNKVTAMCGAAASLDLLEKLSKVKGRPLRVKYGIDPTTANVHLGHTVPLRLLRAFQDDGHTAVIILGDFTATIGDPTGRNELRAAITAEETLAHAKKYKDQIGKVVDLNKAEVHLNSSWFRTKDLAWMLKELQKFTVNQILERDDFSKRMTAKQPVSMHELMYPMLQGFDSVQVEADVELGATEQLFNLNMGRDMQKSYGQEPQLCLTVPILRGTDGEKKMGKSLGNFIAVEEEPFNMFCKVMSIPDDLLKEWYDLLTDIGYHMACASVNPRDAKLQLANSVVKDFHGQGSANAAGTEWVKQFTKRQEPTDIPVHHIAPMTDTLVAIMVLVGLATSKNNARRLIEGGGVDWNGIKVVELAGVVVPQSGDKIRVGRKYVQFKVGS